MIEKLFDLRENTIHQISNSNLFAQMPTIHFTPQVQTCPLCGKALKVYYTDTRKVVTMHIGSFLAHNTFSNCDCHSRVYSSEKIGELVPKYCNYGYSIMVYVGRELFTNHCGINEIKQRLENENVFISASEISFLAAKYVIYLSLAHNEITDKLKKEMHGNGGYILHIDGTCDGDSPHLMSALDEISGFVLHNIKIPTENATDIIALLTDIKQKYDPPLAIVTDMAKAFSNAITEVFDETPHFICHFHFLRDIGKDLLSASYDGIRKKLKTHKISHQLRYRLRILKQMDIQIDDAEMEHSYIDLITGSYDEISVHKACFIMILWCLDAKNSGNGYGFPFDRPHLVLYQRLIVIYEKLTVIKQTLENEGWKNKFAEKLLADMKNLATDSELKKHYLEITEKAEVFDNLRQALHITLSDTKKGLNDNGEDLDIQTIEQKVNTFCEQISSQQKYQSKEYQKLLEQIDKYWNKLFTDPIQVNKPNGDKISIQPQRTNNLLEQFFRDFKRGYTKRSGNCKLNKVLQTMIADTPLIKNLENSNYLTILLNGKNTLEEKFAEIDAKTVQHKLKKTKIDNQKLPKRLKKAIRKTKLMQKYLNL